MRTAVVRSDRSDYSRLELRHPLPRAGAFLLLVWSVFDELSLPIVGDADDSPVRLALVCRRIGPIHPAARISTSLARV